MQRSSAVKDVETQISLLESYNGKDPEYYHEARDRIYEDLTEMIANRELRLVTILKIFRRLKRLNDLNRDIWYA